MLESLSLSNFKAWRKLDMNFGRVTAVFGSNSSGKSSLLQFLLMLKQTKDATDRNLVLDFGGPDDLVNLGNFGDVVHQHHTDSAISWNLAWSLPTPLSINNPMGRRTDILFRGDKLQTRCEVEIRNGSPWANSLKYTFDDTVFSLTPTQSKETEFVLDCDDDSFAFVRNRGRAWSLPGPQKTYLFPNQAKTFYQNSDFIGEFELEYENLMDRIFYLGPLREYPRRQYTWAGARPNDVGQRGERTIDAILAATIHGERRHRRARARYRPFEEFIADQLYDLGLIDSFRVEEIAPGSNLYRAVVKTERSSTEVSLTDVGVGVSQVLPALVLMFYVPKGSTVIMEQPEIHLHPSVQSRLADAILTAVRTRNIQVIVESHSEHLLRRFQRRVAEGSASSEDVKLYFISSANGVAQLSDLELNKWGQIQNWPDKFFGDELGEIAATQIAALERQMEE